MPSKGKCANADNCSSSSSSSSRSLSPSHPNFPRKSTLTLSFKIPRNKTIYVISFFFFSFLFAFFFHFFFFFPVCLFLSDLPLVIGEDTFFFPFCLAPFANTFSSLYEFPSEAISETFEKIN